VLAAFVAMSGVAEAKRPPKSWARTGCHAMAAAFSGLPSEGPDPYIVGLAEKQLKHAPAAYRATAADESSFQALVAWIVRVGALCRADFRRTASCRKPIIPRACQRLKPIARAA